MPPLAYSSPKHPKRGLLLLIGLVAAGAVTFGIVFGLREEEPVEKPSVPAEVMTPAVNPPIEVIAEVCSTGTTTRSQPARWRASTTKSARYNAEIYGYRPVIEAAHGLSRRLFSGETPD